VRLARVPAPLLDALLVGIALGDVWVNVVDDDRLGLACTLLAASALTLRRWLPLVTLGLAVPAALVSDAILATLIALYTFAAVTRSRALLAACVTVVTFCFAVTWPLTGLPSQSNTDTAIGLAYALGMAAAPAFLGQLVQARRDLSLRLAEISEVREHERLLTAQTVLATERAQLAREMHDVVSHQVSLIAVRAGALQVSTPDPTVREAATTIRRLTVQTLDELRHMVGVLRASGSLPTELTPQPTLAQLLDLVSGSAIEARLEADLPDGLSSPVQRAIYRTVQEALTNVRKHAPGATATVQVRQVDDVIRTTITNTVALRPALALPSAHHGLIGLRQRAELLHGTIESGPTSDGGYQLRLDLPTGGR
jgi:signal transduction histidine kinase